MNYEIVDIEDKDEAYLLVHEENVKKLPEVGFFETEAGLKDLRVSGNNGEINNNGWQVVASVKQHDLAYRKNSYLPSRVWIEEWVESNLN